jgi:periplasmic protein CpxP/Spy
VMRAMKVVQVGVALAALLTTGAAVRAQAPAPPPGGGMGGFGGRGPLEQSLGSLSGKGRFWNNPTMVDKLKLTDDQRKAMDGIMQDHRMKLIDLHANLERAEVQMQPLMKADQPDEAAILAAIDKVAQARAELEKGNARFLLAIRSKLTPDQWKQMQAMHENREGFRGPRGDERGRWGQGGPGMGGPGQFHKQTPPPPGAPPQEAPGPGSQPPGSGDE